MKTSRPPAAGLINDAAHILVSSHFDCLKFGRNGNDYVTGWYAGRRQGARFVLKHHVREYGAAGRKRVAAAVREWCGYFREHPTWK